MNAVCDYEATCYEEISHAVIHHHFRREIEEVVATDGGRSYCQLASESGFNDAELKERESLSRSIMASLAAKWTARKLGGYDDAKWRASSDYVKASRWALRLNNGDQQGAELLMSWLERKTELLIEQQWREINAATHVLLNTGRLSGAQVHDIIERTRAESVKAE